MNEQSNEQQQGKLQYVTLTYIGKDFVRNFDNEDGSKTKSYKYKFKQNMEQQYSMNFWGYDTTKGAEILVDGELFVIGYVEKPNPKGDKPIKGAKFFGVPDAPQKLVAETTQPQSSAPAPTTTAGPIPLDPIKYAERYRDSKKPMSERTLPDFVGNYIKAINKELYDNMSKIYNEIVHPVTDEDVALD